MNRLQARETARAVLETVPLVMRTVAAELRAAGEFPAPAHFGLLMKLAEQSGTLSDLAASIGVTAPTMSNSVTALVERGWARRGTPGRDRRVVIVEVTPAGRAALDRVGRAAESHLADMLKRLDAASRRQLLAGLAVLKRAFGRREAPPAGRRTTMARTGGLRAGAQGAGKVRRHATEHRAGSRRL